MRNREHFLAYAQGSNNRDFSALAEAVSDSYGSGFEIPVPEGSDEVSCYLDVSSVSAASSLFFAFEASPDGNIWAQVQARTNEVISSPDVEYDMLNATYKIPSLVNGKTAVFSFRMATSEKVRIRLKTDAGSCNVKGIFVFSKRDQYVY